ncbi:MAG: hypothetical protein K0R68_1696 [Mycobacterium sp.]|nr:hypothetical protein [Mycobacterium sp.]
MLRPAPVLGQQVEPEISLGITPDGVGVVGVALGVVVLHQQTRAAQPVLVGAARLDVAGPPEVNPVEHIVAQVTASMRLCHRDR